MRFNCHEVESKWPPRDKAGRVRPYLTVTFPGYLPVPVAALLAVGVVVVGVVLFALVLTWAEAPPVS